MPVASPSMLDHLLSRYEVTQDRGTMETLKYHLSQFGDSARSMLLARGGTSNVHGKIQR